MGRSQMPPLSSLAEGFPKRNPTPSLYQHPLTAIHSLVSAITIGGNHVQLTMFHRQAAC